MKKVMKIMYLAVLVPFLALSQESNTDYGMVQLSTMKCKIGSYDAFETAVKKHNAKYHKDKYAANLWTINTGQNTGTYVWSMGLLTFTDMDGAPGKGDHGKDWTENIEIHIQDYGVTEFWKLNKKLSYSNDKMEKKQTVWLLDIKSDNYHRFEEFMKKVLVINKKNDNEIVVWNNQYTEDDGRDVAITFTYDKYAELDITEWKMKDEYDKEYGDGSWTKALKDWNDFVVSMKRSQWSRVE